MKKLLSVILALVMLLSTFSLSALAQEKGLFDSEDVFYYDILIDDVYYMLEDGAGAVVGFDMEEDDTSPKAGITIPETVSYKRKNFTVTAILESAFSECDYTSVTLPSTITYMGDGAFMYSPYLEKVVIPDACNFEHFGADVFVGTPFEAEIYSKDETVFGKNVLFSYIGNADTYTVSENISIIAPFAFFMSGVKNVILNNNINLIPDYTFASCRNLTEITIPDSVESIGVGAFKDCIKLEKVVLGENVQWIGVDCFANTKLKTIHLGLNVHTISGAFRDCKTLASITIENGHTLLITDGAGIYHKTTYDSRDGLLLEYYLPSKAQGNITLNPDVVAISAYAFYGCKDLKEVAAKELSYVDSFAFANSGITKFTANGEYYIFDSAFKNCKNLNTINLENVYLIDNSAFENCTSLKNVEFCEDVFDIGALAFANTGLTEVEIYGDNCYVYEGAFKDCANLETVRLEKGVSYVGMNAFLNCPKLKTIYLSKSVRFFEDNSFNGCDNVTFELIKGTEGYDYISDNTNFDYEIVGRYTFFDRIIDFFRMLFGLD